MYAVTGTWVPGPDRETPRWELRGVVVLRGELWIVHSDGSTERLDAATNRWVRGPHKPLKRQSFAVAVFRGQLWVTGGMNERAEAFA